MQTGGRAPGRVLPGLRVARKHLPTARSPRSRQLRAHASASTDTWERLSGVELLRSSDGARVRLTDLWRENERAVVAFGSFAPIPEPQLAIQLRREMLPKLKERGVKLFFVSIGTHARSIEFAEVTEFPRDCLFADPESAAYAALGLYKSVGKTFFDVQTPLAIQQRIQQGRTDTLVKEVLPRWQPWLPPKQDQALQQGGMFVFQGREVLFSHRDPATSAHADLQEVLGVALTGLTDCGCEAAQAQAQQ